VADLGQDGRAILITGSSSGIGRAAAERFGARGWRVFASLRQPESGAPLRELAARKGWRLTTPELDVTRDDSVARAVREVLGQTDGRLDVLVNNAGIGPISRFDALRVEDWDAMIDVNIKGVLYGIAAVMPHMMKKKSGHIINVSSVAGHKVRAGSAVYGATKTAVRIISEGLRQEVKPYNIRTTIISPGIVATELPESVTEADIAAGVRERYGIAIPADAFADMVIFAMSQPETVDINEILFRPTQQDF
jgi:NADP-dependent 3-hydroxy acid dehydrogenase YdfG